MRQAVQQTSEMRTARLPRYMPFRYAAVDLRYFNLSDHIYLY